MRAVVVRALVRAIAVLPVARDHTRSYTGAPLDARTLWTARAFNALVAPGLADSGYARFRAAMDEHGLSHRDTNFTVGHIIPRAGGGSDLGANLMAQHAQDNEWLGCRVVSPGELRHCYRQLDGRGALAARRRASSGRRRQRRRDRRQRRRDRLLDAAGALPREVAM